MSASCGSNSTAQGPNGISDARLWNEQRTTYFSHLCWK